MLQYLSLNGEDNVSKCPICNQEVFQEDLRSVIVVDLPHIKRGDMKEFNLVQISASSIVTKIVEEENADFLD